MSALQQLPHDKRHVAYVCACVYFLPQVRRMINVQNAKQPFAQLLAPAMRSAKAEDRPQVGRATWHFPRHKLTCFEL